MIWAALLLVLLLALWLGRFWLAQALATRLNRLGRGQDWRRRLARRLARYAARRVIP